MKKNDKKRKSAGTAAAADDGELRARIAEVAYYRAERRGFAGGSEVEDWLAAEEEVLGGGHESGGDADPEPQTETSPQRR